jgi:hypothetical protein
MVLDHASPAASRARAKPIDNGRQSAPHDSNGGEASSSWVGHEDKQKFCGLSAIRFFVVRSVPAESIAVKRLELGCAEIFLNASP